MSVEDNVLLKNIGEIGLNSFDSQRKCVMIFTGFLSLINLVLICVGLGGASENNENVTDCSWARASIETGKYSKDIYTYVGLKKIVSRNGYYGSATGIDWDDCSGVDYCNGCEIAGNVALTMISIAFVLSIPILIFSCLRTTNARDLNLYKVLTIIFNLLSIILFLVAMGVFGTECFNKLPSDDKYDFGPGFESIATCFVLQILIFILQILTPVKKSNDSLAGNSSSA